MTELKKEKQSLWENIVYLKELVYEELSTLDETMKIHIQGSFLFVIDDKPGFLLTLRDSRIFISYFNEEHEVKNHLSNHSNFEDFVDISNFVPSNARCLICLSGETFHNILSQKIKPKIAFLQSKIKLIGDLKSFLTLVSYLKKSKSRYRER